MDKQSEPIDTHNTIFLHPSNFPKILMLGTELQRNNIKLVFEDSNDINPHPYCKNSLFHSDVLLIHAFIQSCIYFSYNKL